MVHVVVDVGQERNVESSGGVFQIFKWPSSSQLLHLINPEIKIVRTQSANRTVASFGDSSRSTEKMRPNLIAMKNKFSKARN